MTIKPTVLVTAANGNTGFPAALNLLDAGYPVRALVRRETARTKALRQRGAQIVQGSMDDFTDVSQALRGVQRAYFCPPLLPGCLHKAALFAVAAEQAQLEVVVTMNMWLDHPSHPSLHTREEWLAETVFARMRGVGTVTVNPGWFADNYMAALDLTIQLGLLAMPLGDGLNAPPSNEDIGRVVSAILADPAPHLGHSYRPTGPVLLSPQDIAAILAKVVGRPVRYLHAPAGLFAKVAKVLGFPAYTTAQVLAYFLDYQRNAFAYGAPTDVVERIGGRPAEDFATIARRYVAAARSPKPTLTGRLSAMGTMTRAMLTRAPHLDVLARDSDYDLTHASLAADTDTWRTTHGPAWVAPTVTATPARSRK